MSKQTANKWFSMYIRLRTCVKTTNSVEYGRCYTCNKVFKFDDLDCGHGISGRSNAILFDDRIARGQCRTCNRRGKRVGQRYGHAGMYEIFTAKLIEELGLPIYMDILNNSGSNVKIYDFKEIADKYRLKYKELLNQYG